MTEQDFLDLAEAIMGLGIPTGDVFANMCWFYDPETERCFWLSPLLYEDYYD